MSRKKSRSKHKSRKRRGVKWAECEPLELDQDETFYFIAGYTDGGVPFGITWEEYEAELEETRKRNNIISFEEAGPIPIIEMQMTERQWDELVAVYDYHRDELSCFLNVETGVIAMLSDDDPQEGDEKLRREIDEGFNEIYFRVPHPDLDERCELMCGFALSVSSRKLRAKLERALRAERKVFRKFKNTLAENKAELKRYHAFMEASNRERVQGWLESIGVRAVVVR